MEFLERLMQVIVKEGTKIPKAQVERYVSPILSIFLEDILKSKFGNEYVMIAPEFPIRKGTIKKDCERPDQSTNIDFLLYNKTQNKFTFVELKTDSKSFKPSQLEIYNELERICQDESRGIFGQLLCDDLQKIYDATSLKTKYGYLQTQWKNDFNSVNDMEIIYIVPENMKFKEKEPELQTLYFEDFPQSVSIFPQEYKLISQKLKDLDKN